MEVNTYFPPLFVRQIHQQKHLVKVPVKPCQLDNRYNWFIVPNIGRETIRNKHILQIEIKSCMWWCGDDCVMWRYKVTTAFCLRPCHPTFHQYQLIRIFGGGFLINAAFYVAVGMMTVQNKKKINLEISLNFKYSKNSILKIFKNWNGHGVKMF